MPSSSKGNNQGGRDNKSEKPERMDEEKQKENMSKGGRSSQEKGKGRDSEGSKSSGSKGESR